MQEICSCGTTISSRDRLINPDMCSKCVAWLNQLRQEWEEEQEQKKK